MTTITNLLKENFQAILLVILTIGLAVSFGNQPTINVAGSNEQVFNTLTASGTADVKTQPDEAQLSLGVVTEGDTAEAAGTANAEISQRVIQQLKAQGVRESDIKTTSYYVYPKTNWDSDTGQSHIYGYTATNTISVKSTDTAEVGKLVDAAVGAGANNVNSVYFAISDEKQKQIYAQALQQASADGASKARSMAQAIGVSLVRLKSISESGLSYNPYPVYRDVAMAGSAPKAETQILPPEELTVSASVSVVYEIG